MGRKADSISLSLRLVEETSTTIVGEDAEGDRRTFQKADLQSCVVSRRFESVSVVLARKTFKAIKPMRVESAPNAGRTIRKKRRCLNCRHEFKAHPSSFICDPCKKMTSWRMGGDYSLVG